MGILALYGTLSACATLPQSGFSFATRGEQISDQHARAPSQQTKTQAQFAQGKVTLVAPSGHCLDLTMLRQEAQGGFALLPRCNLIHGNRLFGRNRAAVITATIGPAKGAEVPTTAELAKSAEGATLLYYEDKGLLPLVRLKWPGHSAMGGSGASEEHWRGAFVVNDHLVVLALYAPEGSALLGPVGAELLTEMTRRSQKASTKAEPKPEAVSARRATTPPMAQETPASSIRPKSRPTTQRAGSGSTLPKASEAPVEKLSLRRRIGGLFRTPPPARLTTE
ncbi:MAG: hypothetical protein BM558_09650 [Roseobacter sp. MedPE-SW]|nr:MAG: hypothetical protein BM558_09650 [Roseobacter sp. MedPE-SW]